uniref:Phorbol-ester/DAG-type domain-containing protein n=1 Tax=Romanomermis culicivorax TaxID=13658 RepID=A0A915JGW0_ROMCU
MLAAQPNPAGDSIDVALNSTPKVEIMIILALMRILLLFRVTKKPTFRNPKNFPKNNLENKEMPILVNNVGRLIERNHSIGFVPNCHYIKSVDPKIISRSIMSNFNNYGNNNNLPPTTSSSYSQQQLNPSSPIDPGRVSPATSSSPKRPPVIVVHLPFDQHSKVELKPGCSVREKVGQILSKRMIPPQVRKSFFVLTYCNFCFKPIWLQGFRCELCSVKFHQRCWSKVPTYCEQIGNLKSNDFKSIIEKLQSGYFNRDDIQTTVGLQDGETYCDIHQTTNRTIHDHVVYDGTTDIVTSVALPSTSTAEPAIARFPDSLDTLEVERIVNNGSSTLSFIVGKNEQVLHGLDICLCTKRPLLTIINT